MTEFAKRTFDEDIAWLTQDPLAQAFREMLESFAGPGRYYHLDKAEGETPKGSDAKSLMTALENKVAKTYGFDVPPDFQQSADSYYAETSRQIIGLAQRYHRAIARLFVYGFMGGLGTNLSAGPMHHLACLRDDDLMIWPPKSI